MLWLQSNENYECIAIFDPIEYSLKKFLRTDIDSITTEGFFSEIDDGIFILYKNGDKLFFRVYNSNFMLDEQTIIEVSGPVYKRNLSVIKNGKVIFQTTYTLNEPLSISDDLTPFLESEDFDFGLFVSNISKNPKRKAVLLGKA